MIDSMAFHKYSVFIRYLILMKYRSRTDIVGLILEAANGGGVYQDKDNVQSLPVLCTVKGIPNSSTRKWFDRLRRRKAIL